MLPNQVVTGNVSISKRIDAVDVAKGIGILLVVFAHIHDTGRLCTIIYSFHMPLFFIISGMMFNKDKYPTFRLFLKQRIKTLICPYLLFSILSFIFWLCFNVIYWEGFSAVFSTGVYSTALEIFISRGSHYMLHNRPMWFVLCLFAVEIIYYFLRRIKNKYCFCIIVVSLAAFGWFLESSYCPIDSSFLPWNLASAMFALSFYAFGNTFMQRITKLIIRTDTSKKKMLLLLSVFVICFAIVVPLALLNGSVSLGSRNLQNGFLFFITGCLGTIGIISLSQVIRKSKVLRFFGKNSFYIMATHIPPTIVYPIIWSKIEKEFGWRYFNKDNLLESIPPFLITVLLCSLFTLMYNKIKKSLLARRKTNG